MSLSPKRKSKSVKEVEVSLRPGSIPGLLRKRSLSHDLQWRGIGEVVMRQRGYKQPLSDTISRTWRT